MYILLGREKGGKNMEEARKHQLQIILYESGERNLRDLAQKLGDPKYSTRPKKVLVDKQLLQLLARIIDPASFHDLAAANKCITKIKNFLIRNGGWYASEDGITCINLEDRAKKNFPEETKGERLYHLDRDENGYHLLNSTDSEASIVNSIRKIEADFLENRKELLESLHNAYLVRENVLGGSYRVRNGFEELARLLCEYFGYVPKNKKVPTV